MTMKHITSRENPLFKELKQLASSSQARRKAGRTLLEGVHLCEAYLQTAGAPPLCVVSEGSVHHPEVAPLIEACQTAKGIAGQNAAGEARQLPQCIVFPEAMYNALSQVEQGIGVLFVVDTPAADMPARLDHAAVLLDRLQDPGNLGSILRSAAAAGIGSVYCSSETVFAWSPKVLRAGMGAHFLLRIVENVDLAALIERADVPVLATSSHVPQTIYDADLTGPCAWLFGHEGQGVAPALLARASQQLTIPQLGAIESMNVAASAAVCFFEQVRQQRRT